MAAGADAALPMCKIMRIEDETTITRNQGECYYTFQRIVGNRRDLNRCTRVGVMHVPNERDAGCTLELEPRNSTNIIRVASKVAGDRRVTGW